VRIVIVNVQEPFGYGGAEILAEDLRDALIDAGHPTEIVAIPWTGHPADRLLANILAFRLMDLTESRGVGIDRLIGLKFPAYLIPHRNKVVWLIHQHRAAYELWNDEYGLSRLPGGAQAREAVRRADLRAFGEARRVLTISRNVSARLERTLGCGSLAVYPPPRNAAKFYCESDERYFFFPSRSAPLKRQRLVVTAMALTRQPVRVVFTGDGAGSGGYGAELRGLADELGLGERCEWLEWVPESELLRWYAHCRAVVFPPLDEDYGFITLEAMLASKPVLTCRDSGATLEFVAHGETGLAVEPNKESVALGMDELWADPDRARRWGQAGRRRIDDLAIGWPKVVQELLA
jgi:glycosyltransferase involved in cell wall biosynthesis